MKINKFSNSIVAVVIGFMLFVPDVFAAAFGVSPPWIVNENLKPGSSFVYVIDLSTNDFSRDMMVQTKIAGEPEIVSWLTIKDQENLIMPKGEKIVPMYVQVNVPKDAKLGRYDGNIFVTVAPKDQEKENVSILLGGNISVKLDVINYDVTDYWVKSVAVNSIMEGKPLSLTLAIKNLGNTNITDMETIVELADYKTEDIIAKVTGSELHGVVYPHTIKEVKLTIPYADLEAGKYWANVNVLKHGESVYKNRLYLAVGPSPLNTSVKTAVEVSNEKGLKAAAVEEPLAGGVGVKTAVRVRAPGINNLILVGIGLLIVLVVATGKICLSTRKKKQG